MENRRGMIIKNEIENASILIDVAIPAYRNVTLYIEINKS
jgi:hypothetical protein